MKTISPKTHLLEHSEAKVHLYGAYFSRYLNILSRTSYVQRIFLFDLLCGEGILENGGKGSPLIALETIRNHYFSNQQTCPNITIWFNDLGNSEIEKNVPKIERVKRFTNSFRLPRNVQIEFFQEDYETIYPKAIETVNNTKQSKGLFFIDPYGYKSIKPSDIQKMLLGGKTEVFLWLPLSFMYRFANVAFKTDFPGSEPLREFLRSLFGKDVPEFKSAYDFIEKITGRFRTYLREQEIIVDFYILERDSSNLYCMLFFTSNLKGAEAMISAKWEMDANRGKGHTIDKSPSFSEVQMSGYGQKLKAFIESAEYRTNNELYKFGLENGFLPKHTNEVLRIWKNDNLVRMASLDGKAVRGFYIEYKSDRLIGFQILNKLL